MNDRQSHKPGWQANVMKQTAMLGYWTLAWLLTMAVANFDAEISHLIILTGVTYLTSLIVLNRRFR